MQHGRDVIATDISLMLSLRSGGYRGGGGPCPLEAHVR